MLRDATATSRAARFWLVTAEPIQAEAEASAELTKGADHCEPSPPPSQSSQWQEQQPQQPHEAQTESTA